MNPVTVDLQNPSRSDVLAFVDRINHHLRYSLGHKREEAHVEDMFRAVALAARHDLIDKMIETTERYERQDPKRIYYLSIEFLIGRFLQTNLQNLGLYEISRRAVAEFGMDLDEILEVEPDAGLGNGGLGRLAACFLDSMAALGIPGYGYGIHYEYGLFKQEIDNGYQRERPDNWMSQGVPWEVRRQNRQCYVPVYGFVEEGVDRGGGHNPMWFGWQRIIGMPYDIPVVGYGGKTVNVLRLFGAHSSDDFDISIFNSGDYIKAVEQKISAETITKVLYPSDAVLAGRELRLLQEYFLVACALRDIIKRFQRTHQSFDNFADKVAIQLNDTHPALAVAEMMRALVDQYELPWESAWKITRATFGYTNHTLLPEALERWPVSLLERLLPRHTQIIYEINRRFLDEVAARFPGDAERQSRVSLVEEGPEKMVRMANLAIVGSHSVNGVSELHSELVRTRLVPGFAEMWPERFNNKTNGVTHRRWLLYSNPGLAGLLIAAIGDGWIRDFSKLRGLERFAEVPGFRDEFLRVKRDNKQRLAALIQDSILVSVSPDSLFDVHVKRIHEYKRQLLNAMHMIHLYLSIVEDGAVPAVARTCIFAGKAAPGYAMAKLIIKLIHNIARVIHKDPKVGDKLRVAFLPDYRVSLAERIIPAADLSEQISTAGMEASGTGNMKLAMNGAITIGTLDGANIEIGEEVGSENIYIFGLTAEQIEAHCRNRTYNPWDFYHGSPAIRRVMDALGSDRFCPSEPGLFQPIYQAVMNGGDRYFHLADFESYAAAQARAAQDYTDRTLWARKAILNVARIGKFTSDRTIAEYARDIWNVAPALD
jgi:glycogen phosphorylase